MLKQAGIVSYFLGLHKRKLRDMISQDEYREFLKSDESALLFHQTFDGNSTMAATLMDGLVSESLLVFLYGISTALDRFVGKIVIAKALKRLV